jgi:pectate lyase
MSKKILFLLLFLYLLNFSYGQSMSNAQLPCFPGAQGFGTLTPGGRGGRIIEVTNLNSDGPGSLRAACEAEGPRVVVFRTGGLINIVKTINIRNPFITIAGQTAPGDGICLGGGAGLNISTHDVIVRGLRVRVGDNPEGPVGDNRDGIGVANNREEPYNIVLDHCSVSWAIDENIQLWYPCHNITIQWCITSEALDSSLHEKGPHSKGMIIGPGAKNISIHHNLFAHNVERNPLISVDTRSEVINNVVYNWKSRGLNIGNCYPEHSEESDIINNYFIKGPSSRNNLCFHVSDCWKHAQVYVKGNIGPGREEDKGDEWSLVRNDVKENQIKIPERLIKPSMVTIHPVKEAYELVLEKAGAITPQYDAIDKRIVEDVRNKTGAIIDSQKDVSGWPSYNNGTPPSDSDHDGMPDEWEKAHRLNPKDAKDASKTDKSGYTNIEVYINSLIK